MEENESDDFVDLDQMNIGQHGSSKLPRKELFLDTKGSCFLCLKEICSDADNNHNDDQGMTEVSFRNICRYLNISPSSILLQSLKGEVSNDDGKEEASSRRNKCDFSVTLCLKCSTLSKRLTELIHQEEMTKLLINNNLHEFNRILVESENDAGDNIQGAKFQEKMSRCATTVETNLVHYLRRETKEKSSGKLEQMLKTSFPQVLLKRIRHQISLTNVPAPENEPPPPSPPPEPASKFVFECPKEWIRQILRKKLPDNRYQCPFCPNIGSYNHIRPHLIIVHLDRFFLQKNFFHLSEVKFKMHCKRILLTETKKAAILPGLRQPKKRNYIYNCSPCNQTYTLTGFQHHFVLKHSNVLEVRLLKSRGVTIRNPNDYNKPVVEHSEEKIKKISVKNKPSTLIKEAKCNPSNKSSSLSNPIKCNSPKDWLSKMIPHHCKQLPGENQYQCPFCDKIGTGASLRCHLLTMHLEKYFSQKGSIKAPEENIRNWCRTLICGEIKSSKPRNPAKSKSASSETKPIQKRKRTIKCKICSRKYSHDSGFKFHFILKHHLVFQKKLCKMQNLINNSRKKFTTGTIAKQKLPVIKIEDSIVSKILSKLCKVVGFKKKNDLANNYRCLLCKNMKRKYKKFIIYRHLVNVHPENIFWQSRLENISEKDFKLYCKYVLTEASTHKETNTITSNPPESKLGLYFCKHCKFKHRQPDYLRYHLVMEHYKILKEKLACLQTWTQPNRVTEFASSLGAEEATSEEDAKDNRKMIDPVKIALNLTSNIGTERTLAPKISEKINSSKSKDTANHNSPKDWITDLFKDIKKVGKTYSCPFCETVSQRVTIRAHLISHHAEKFLVKRFFLEMPETDVKACYQKILATETRKAKQKRNGTNRWNYLCRLCKKVVRRHDNFKNHFLLVHFHTLEESLKDEQTNDKLEISSVNPKYIETPLLSGILSNMRTECGENLYRCKSCDSMKPSPKNVISSHLVNIHTEGIFQRNRLQNVSKSDFISCCKQVLSEESNQIVAGHEIERGGRQRQLYRCQYCDCHLGYRPQLRYHLVVRHYEALVKKLICLQKRFKEKSAELNDKQGDNSLERKAEDEKSKTDNFFSQIFAKHSRKEVNRKNVTTGYRCLACPKLSKVYPRQPIEKHLVNVHPDLYFAHIRPLQFSEENFLIRSKCIITEKSNAKQISSSSTGKSPGLLCTFCGVRNRNNYNLRYHLMLNHHDILEQKILNFQDEKIIIETTEDDQMQCNASTNKKKTTANPEVSKRRKLIRAKISQDHLDWVPPRGHRLKTNLKSRETRKKLQRITARTVKKKITSKFQNKPNQTTCSGNKNFPMSNRISTDEPTIEKDNHPSNIESDPLGNICLDHSQIAIFDGLAQPSNDIEYTIEREDENDKDFSMEFAPNDIEIVSSQHDSNEWNQMSENSIVKTEEMPVVTNELLPFQHEDGSIDTNEEMDVGSVQVKIEKGDQDLGNSSIVVCDDLKTEEVFDNGADGNVNLLLTTVNS